jgi:5-methyltetrahydropteroyltriglutamate--homocysteine methyltransferase
MKQLAEYAPGTILNEVFSAWRWPRVIGKVGPREGSPLDYAKIWRLAQVRATKPVRFGTVSAQGIPHFLDVREGSYLTDERRELIWDMATAMNKELRELAASGCTVIQLEEPLLHSIEIYLERINADVIAFEMKENAGAELRLFAPFKKTMRRKIAIGTVSHRSLQVERPDEVADLAREALQFIDPENLILTSDCGFGRQGCNRLIAYYKAAALAQGANIVRQELGFEGRYIPAADPKFLADQPA